MRSARLEGALCILIGILICFLAWSVGIGNFTEPGSGFFALISGLALVLIGSTMFLQEAFSKIYASIGSESQAVSRITSKRPLLYTIALLVAYILFLNTLGYIVSTFLLMLGLFYNRQGGFFRALLASLVTTGATYLVFEVWLRCLFPRGIFPWW